MAVRRSASAKVDKARSRKANAEHSAAAEETAAKPPATGRPRSEISRVALLETAYRLMKKIR